MSAITITDSVWWIGVKDPDLAVFDVIMQTEHGTTYNAYLVKGEESIAIIDTVKAEFTDDFIAKIESITGLKKIRYLIVNHTEPDHSGSINALLDRIPDLEIICAAPALPFVKNVLNREANIRTVKNNETLDLGGKTLQFISTPYMHWPDTMMEYLTDEKVLFSCDGFAAHVSFDSLWADECTEDFDYEMWYYYDAIMRPFATYIRRNLTKISELDVSIIAQSHGPVIREKAKSYINRYTEWAEDKAEGSRDITIFYVSSYGNTLRMAQELAIGLRKLDYNPILINSAEMDEDEARDRIESSVALLFGTPTFAGDAVRPIWDAVNLLSTVPATGKKVAVFGSFGWGGEGTKLVADRLSGLRLKVYEEQYRARLIPSEEELAQVEAFCKGFAEFVG